MEIKYEYNFTDGFTMRFPQPLTFNLLKMAVDSHGGLVSCKKVAVVTEVYEIES